VRSRDQEKSRGESRRFTRRFTVNRVKRRCSHRPVKSQSDTKLTVSVTIKVEANGQKIPAKGLS
jgi:hypothetical protein